MVTSAPTERVGKRCDCDWNRYCAFVGDFRPEQLVALGIGRSVVVGRCYACERYICNRCADRWAVDGVHAALAEFDLARLHCPFDGEPLGREQAWVIVGAARQVVESGATLTTRSVAEAIVSPTPVDPSVHALLTSAVAAFQAGAHTDVLHACAASPKAAPWVAAFLVLQRLALEGVRRFDDAWRVQDALLKTPAREMIVALGVLSRSLPREDPAAELIANALVASIRVDHESRIERTVAHLLAPDVPPPFESTEPESAPEDSHDPTPSPATPTNAGAVHEHAGPPSLDERTGAIVTADACGAPAILVGETLAYLCWTSGEGRAAIADLDDAIVRRSPPVDAGLARDAVIEALSGADGGWFTADGRDGVAFADRTVERAFVARVFIQRLFGGDRPDLKLAGLRPIDGAAAEVIAAAIADVPDRRARLDEWQRFDRQRRSLFRGADVPMLVRNLALIRLALTGEARELDLCDADFAGLDLSGADFSNARLDGASFRGATLREARFRSAHVLGADFTGADLGGAILDQ